MVKSFCSHRHIGRGWKQGPWFLSLLHISGSSEGDVVAEILSKVGKNNADRTQSVVEKLSSAQPR